MKTGSENKKEQVFLEITKDLERIIDDFDSNIIYWKKNNKCYFEQNENNKVLWCDYDLVWFVFEDEFGINYDETQAFIRDMMEKHHKLGYLTPKQVIYNIFVTKSIT